MDGHLAILSLVDKVCTNKEGRRPDEGIYERGFRAGLFSRGAHPRPARYDVESPFDLTAGILIPVSQSKLLRAAAACCCSSWGCCCCCCGGPALCIMDASTYAIDQWIIINYFFKGDRREFSPPLSWFVFFVPRSGRDRCCLLWLDWAGWWRHRTAVPRPCR